MRSLLSLAASALAGLAAVISSLDHHADFVPFFVGLSVLGGVNAWAVDGARLPARRWVAVGTAFAWLTAIAWFSVLMVMSVTVWQASGPPPVPDEAFLGLPATAYRMLGLVGGGALVTVATFAPGRWISDRSQTAAG
jgi:hypothetical protein